MSPYGRWLAGRIVIAVVFAAGAVWIAFVAALNGLSPWMTAAALLLAAYTIGEVAWRGWRNRGPGA